MDEVTPIKDYRDDHVAHAGPLTFPDHGPILRIRADRHEIIMNSSGATATPDVTDVLLRYVNAWLDYLETVPLPFAWPPISARSTG